MADSKEEYTMSKFILSAFADEIDMDLNTQMEVLKEHDISYIEMRGVNGKCIVDYSLEEAKEIKKQLDKNGFKLSSIGSPIGKIGINDPFDTHLELFKHTMEIAKVMDCKYIRMFSFYIPDGEDPEKYRDEVISRWKGFVKAAEGSGLILLHENEKGIYGDTAERCLDILKTLDCSYVKAIFDPANFVQCNVKTYPEAYELLKDHVVYMHIKDAVYSDGHVEPAGYGDGKVKEILTDLYNKGYEGFLSIEPHLGFFEGFTKLELDDGHKKLPEGGPKLFAMAAKALKDMLNEIA